MSPEEARLRGQVDIAAYWLGVHPLDAKYEERFKNSVDRLCEHVRNQGVTRGYVQGRNEGELHIKRRYHLRAR